MQGGGRVASHRLEMMTNETAGGHDQNKHLEIKRVKTFRQMEFPMSLIVDDMLQRPPTKKSSTLDLLRAWYAPNLGKG